MRSQSSEVALACDSWYFNLLRGQQPPNLEPPKTSEDRLLSIWVCFAGKLSGWPQGKGVYRIGIYQSSWPVRIRCTCNLNEPSTPFHIQIGVFWVVHPTSFLTPWSLTQHVGAWYLLALQLPRTEKASVSLSTMEEANPLIRRKHIWFRCHPLQCLLFLGSERQASH